MLLLNPQMVALRDDHEHPCQEGWCRQSAVSLTEVTRITDDITGIMKMAGYQAKDIFALRLALEEAVVNAIKHGHKGRPSKPVRVRYQVTPEQVLVEVEDQGPGFDPKKVPDPLSADNLENSSGRGLLLMRSFTTWMRHNERGNCVTLCKRLSLDA